MHIGLSITNRTLTFGSFLQAFTVWTGKTISEYRANQKRLGFFSLCRCPFRVSAEALFCIFSV